MNELDQSGIDINRADGEQLASVPGIGPVLAGRIVQARPFATLDDLRRVSGINSQSLENMRPYLTITGNGDQQAPEIHGEETGERAALPPLETADAKHLQAQAQPASPADRVIPPEPAAATAHAGMPAATNPPAQDTFVRRADAIWWGIGLAVAVLIISLIFSLGTLGAINRTLSYAPASRVLALQADMESLSAQIENVDGEVNSLRTRMDLLEGLSGRVDSLEKETGALNSQLEMVQEQTAELERKADELSVQVSELQKSSAVFQNFLDGLRKLLIENE